MSLAAAVAAQYPPPISTITWRAWVGGWSGSTVFAGDLNSPSSPDFCLKAWPANTQIRRVLQLHRWLMAASDLPFVPHLVLSASGTSAVSAHGCLWDITDWKTGRADFREHPSPLRLQAACRAIAKLHTVWKSVDSALEPFPAVARRLDLLSRWPEISQQPLRVDAELAEVMTRASRVLPRMVPWAERALRPWLKPVAVQPCLCDVHHDHVLFHGNDVTGIIDFHAMKLDHPAVDLARYLGDCLPESQPGWHDAIEAYHEAGGCLDVSRELIEILDRTGVICAVLHWLQRLNAPPGPNSGAVVQRFVRFLERLESEGL